jgi:hypothetical protein
MINMLMFACLVVVLPGLASAAALGRLLRRTRHHEVSVDWLNNFSISRYNVMERLLSDSDLEFVKAQKGCGPKLARRLRMHRQAIFRLYLHSLSKDFRNLESALMLYMSASRVDRPDLARVVVKQRIIFTWAFLQVRFRVALYGVGVGTANPGKLIGSLSGLRLELSQMVLSRQAVAA